MRPLVSLALLSLLALPAACGDDGGSPTPFPVADECNPLGAGHCMVPWPSSVYELADAASATGVRLDIPVGGLLTNANGDKVAPGPWNKADGFSAAAAIVTAFPGGVDGANLVDQLHFGDSLGAASPTVLLDLTTGERVAHFAELDVTAASTPDSQALYIRPAARLTAGHRYGVAIRKSLKSKAGGALPISPGFQALLDGADVAHPLFARARASFGALRDALATAGVPADDLVLAWDFTVASDEFVRRLPTSARDQVVEHLATTRQTYRIDDDSMVDANIRRRIDAFVTAPLFLTQGGAFQPGTTLALDSAGLPAYQGMYEIPFTAVIPTCAYTAAEPVGIMMYGHGLNGSGQQAASGAIRDTAAAACVISIGTDMRGMSERDIGNIARALSDLNYGDEIFETLVQGIANHVALERAMETVLAEELFVCRAEDAAATGCTTGAQLADPTKLYYYGLSQGHIFGTTVIAYTKKIRRAVIGVGGGNYSTMLERSTDWPTYKTILSGTYPDPFDVVLAISLFQQRWDQTETSGVANVVLAGTATGTPPKQILMHMAIGDDEVPNLATEWQARTMGVPVLAPASVYTPYGMTAADSPIVGGSALVIMDGGAPAVPLTNEPAPETGMHNLTRTQAASRRQIKHFFETGEIVNECAGACMCAAHQCD
ncbi:MAG: hypothetical protein IPL61_36920 [Myxococcales bacterium]|nr:hypothetical protein [Myxococcales bacterium]